MARNACYKCKWFTPRDEYGNASYKERPSRAPWGHCTYNAPVVGTQSEYAHQRILAQWPHVYPTFECAQFDSTPKE